MSSIKIDGHRIDVLFTQDQIAERNKSLAAEIAVTKPVNLLVVPVLKGSFIFAADLIRAMHHAGLSPEVDFMILASYRQAKVSSGVVDVLRDIESQVKCGMTPTNLVCGVGTTQDKLFVVCANGCDCR